jgi:CubicO group peptidase (beta-lactamase class C family)
MRKTKVILKIIVGFIYLLAPLFVIAQEAEAEASIRTIMSQTNVVGVSVAVVKNNKIIYSHSFGQKNIEANTPLTDDCIFRIASISKSFSATSIMQLVQAKKLSLEEDASDLIGFPLRNPKFPDKVITLKMLLSHRSSINDSQGYFSLDSINPATNPDYAKCYNNYAPGAGYMYCNLNYNMTGAIIEKYSGERFDQYVKHHVLDPLDIYGGYCVDSLDKNRFATIYEFNKETAKFINSPNAYAPRSKEIADYAMGKTTPIFSPTGGMKISATDLAKYMIMHMNLGKANGKRIISKRSARLMQTPLSSDENYGLAILKTDKLIEGKTLRGHTGSAYGLYSTMFFEPNEKFGIVVISNGCNPVYDNGFNAFMKNTVNSLYKNLIAQ